MKEMRQLFPLWVMFIIIPKTEKRISSQFSPLSKVFVIRKEI